MKIRVSELRLGIDEDTSKLLFLACAKLKIEPNQVSHWWIERQALDARRKKEISFVYTVVIETKEDFLFTEALPQKSQIVIDDSAPFVIRGTGKITNPPVVVGAGPAGLFAALLLARWGYCPIVLERGKRVFDRHQDVVRFWKEGVLDPESNVQFGEGGAGTFSDGKLTTRTKDVRAKMVLEALVDAGAPQEIIYQAKPHLGTDKLRNVVVAIRNEIIALGGKVLFESKVTDFVCKGEILQAVIINNTYELPASCCVLAIGHSARDTYHQLMKREIAVEAKPFAVGFRVEHPQHMIDQAQYGEWSGNPRLGAADYHMTYTHTDSGRGVYSFCMCPGGQVIGASSEAGHLAINGMSYYSRSSGTSNAAIVVSVDKDDFCEDDPLAGMRFQQELEKKAFVLGGGNYYAPVQTVDDFIEDHLENTSTRIGQATYTPGVQEANLREVLPTEIGEALGCALKEFNKKIWGFASSKGILTGVETRTSAPVKILRQSDGQSISLQGLYPAGEGAGYAGGIISASVDGIRAAQKIIEMYAPPSIEVAERTFKELEERLNG